MTNGQALALMLGAPVVVGFLHWLSGVCHC
jgi:hypothetical protein